MMSFGISKIDILNIHGVHYCFIIFGITKREAINLFKKAD